MTIMKRCPLCENKLDGNHKFCDECYDRAAESIDRKAEGILAPEQAVRVALTYLAPLYDGQKPLTVADEIDLVALAVTIATDLRRARAEIVDLREQLSRPSQADLELAGLIVDPKQ